MKDYFTGNLEMFKLKKEQDGKCSVIIQKEILADEA